MRRGNISALSTYRNLGISTRRSGNHENPIDDRGVTTVSTHTTIDDYTPWMKNDSLVQIREELLKSCKMFMVMFAIDAGEEVTGRHRASFQRGGLL